MAKTNYVDCAFVGCSAADYAAHDGSSWDKAFATLQEGVDACSQNDTVLVAKGRYDKGGFARDDESGMTNRVYISTKGLTIKAVAGKHETFIVGSHDPDPVDVYGNGPNAVRCVFCYADECVIEGFTLTDFDFVFAGAGVGELFGFDQLVPGMVLIFQ